MSSFQLVYSQTNPRGFLARKTLHGAKGGRGPNFRVPRWKIRWIPAPCNTGNKLAKLDSKIRIIGRKIRLKKSKKDFMRALLSFLHPKEFFFGEPEDLQEASLPNQQIFSQNYPLWWPAWWGCDSSRTAGHTTHSDEPKNIMMEGEAEPEEAKRSKLPQASTVFRPVLRPSFLFLFSKKK